MSVPRICVIQPNRTSYSERFIQAQVEGLPAAQLLYGGWFPRWRATQTGELPLAPPPFGAARLLGQRLPPALRRPVRLVTDLGLAAALRAARIEVVLAEYGPTGAEVLRACRWAGAPLVVHFHGADAFAHGLLGEYGARYRSMFAAAAAIVVVSRAMEHQLLALGASPTRLHYLPYGADLALFAGADPGAAPPHFLAVGRFVDKKAPYLSLLAFGRVYAACPAARLTMVGDGPLLEACRRIALANGLGEAVRFPGPLAHTAVAALMRGSRAFVQHSLRADSGDAEGTPVVMLEAGAAGLPVVATRHGGIPELVVEGESGLLVDEGDLDGMARHMLALAEQPALAGRLGARAASHIRANFSQKQQLSRLRALLAGVWREARP